MDKSHWVVISIFRVENDQFLIQNQLTWGCNCNECSEEQDCPPHGCGQWDWIWLASALPEFIYPRIRNTCILITCNTCNTHNTCRYEDATAWDTHALRVLIIPTIHTSCGSPNRSSIVYLLESTLNFNNWRYILQIPDRSLYMRTLRDVHEN